MIKSLLLNNVKNGLLILSVSFGIYNCKSQNLIANGSFENYSNIDCGAGGFDNYSMAGTPHVVDNWYSLNSPDYYNSVCNPGGFNVPNSYFGYSMAENGSAYIGLIGFVKAGETKEYAYQYLSSPLQAGEIYCLSFNVTRADRITHAIKNIGAFFSVSTPTLFSNYYVNAVPQVENQTGFITDTTSWSQIQGCFTANGGEQYITIGNFNSNANTDTLYVGTNNLLSGGNGYAYYYIDDVTLIDQTTVGVKEIKLSHKFNLFPNPNNGSMQLDYDLGSNSDATFKLFDVTGRLINSFKLENTKGSLQMNEQTMHNGIYFYHILVGEKTIKTDKIVIIR